MHCFNHKEIFAIGTCRSCNKALCENCFNFIIGCLCCKDLNCQKNIEIISELTNISCKIYMIGEYKNKKINIHFKQINWRRRELNPRPSAL